EELTHEYLRNWFQPDILLLERRSHVLSRDLQKPEPAWAQHHIRRAGHLQAPAEPYCPFIEYAAVRVYQTPQDLNSVLAEACGADLIIKHSGVGADDDLLEREILHCASERTRVAFWDVDAPATLAR